MIDKMSIFLPERRWFSPGMFNIFYILNPWRKSSPSVQLRSGDADWCSDPLSHPVIRAMDINELADLPFRSAREQGRR